ncbi:apoptotic chromatin condensation inducer in the nucleus [Drosophila tropicalis]|uniref:apoptotic chromatin condensation inducer in the nucleus n=1 Tax=Drosophila tropicalis TaxID=46794 RepID=UPI0035AC0DD1
MRRRSERKKSTSPSPLPARRSRRSRRVSEDDKTEDETLGQSQNKSDATKEVLSAKTAAVEINENESSQHERGERASSEDHAIVVSASPMRKSRSTRTTPKKRSDGKTNDRKVDSIPEEEVENGTETAPAQRDDTKSENGDEKPQPPPTASSETIIESESVVQPQVSEDDKPVEDKPQSKDHREDDNADQEVDKRKEKGAEPTEEVKVPSPSISLTANADQEQLKTSSDVLDIQTEDVEEKDEGAAANASKSREKRKKIQKVAPRTSDDEGESFVKETESHSRTDEVGKENRKEEENEIQGKQISDAAKEQPTIQSTTTTTTTEETVETASSQRSVRKRKWLTNKTKSDRAPPVLAISTDSLKNIIADVVQPVPLSDVQLESSSEEEGLVTSDHESDERRSRSHSQSIARSISPAQPEVVAKSRKERISSDDHDQDINSGKGGKVIQTPAQAPAVPLGGPAPAPALNKVVRSEPSPARNRSSHVLYITNLVRPFTVLQLKGLLARTGKIIEEDGFWIDRIKSKCYVAYATEDEAIETRHALHGVRWPVSNPKCLNVDFGSRTDMDRCIQSTKDEGPKYGQENTRDNQQSGNAWSRLDASEKKPVARPVREWDVGKKEPNDRDNNNSNSKATNERRRGNSKERTDARSRSDADRSTGQERKRSRERDRGGRDRSDHARDRSRSGSPAAKTKRKENEPPIRLLDDLFRKTKGTPCIYWLPLTPEAIAEKEALRQKRIEEHKQRIKEREERQKERDNTRRNRSNERRRSRSRERERRRY